MNDRHGGVGQVLQWQGQEERTDIPANGLLWVWPGKCWLLVTGLFHFIVIFRTGPLSSILSALKLTERYQTLPPCIWPWPLPIITLM